MQSNNQAVRIDSSVILEPLDALKLYEEHGGQITTFSPFGQDPLEDHSDLFKNENPSSFSNIQNLDPFSILL